MERLITGSRIFTTGLLFVLFIGLSISAMSQTVAERPRPVFEKGKVLLKFERGVNFNVSDKFTGVSAVDDILWREEVQLIAPLHRKPVALHKGEMSPEAEVLSRIIVIEYASTIDPEALAKELSELAEVVIAEPNEICFPDYTPNDPRVPQQWAITMMQLEQAWEITQGSEDVLIGIVDSGVQYNHPDLESNIYRNYGEWGTSGELSNNGVDDDNNGYIDDHRGWDFGDMDNDPMDRPATIMGIITYHGTGVSGSASAATDNGTGIAGPGFKCKIVPLKAARDDQGGMSAGYPAIIYAADMGVHVINNSWGGTRYSAISQDVIYYANSLGSLVIGSSGNDPVNNDFDRHFPSAFDKVFSVGSQEPDGSPSDYATFGASVDVMAPGTGVLTTRFGGGYEFLQGTSFSAPLTSGVAALVRTHRPTWSPEQVAKQIRVTSSKFETPRNPQYYGYVNAYRALTMNETMGDIPGIIVKSFNYTTETSPGTRFRQPGEKATVSVTFENVLAPTSQAASVSIFFDDTDQLTATPSTFSLGAMNTGDTAHFTFEVELAQLVKVAEGVLPIRFNITDGEYVDYVVKSFDILIDDAWRTKYSPDEQIPGDARFTAIDIITDKFIWAVAKTSRNNYCRRTINGGTSWTNADGNGFPSSREVYCIEGVSTGTALVGTGGSTIGIVYRTTNSGQDWTYKIISTITKSINGIHMFDASNGLLVGDPNGGKWGIAKTSDGGANWTALTPAVSAPNDSIRGWANSFEVLNNNMWFGTNQNLIYHSQDNGNTWTSYPTPGMHLVKLSFRDELVGAARFNTYTDADTITTGENGIAITKDGGMTWTMLNTINLENRGNVAYEPKGKRLWAVNWDNVYMSRDIGESWQVEAVPRGFDSVYASDIYATTSSNGRTVVYSGGINLITYLSPWEEYTSSAIEPTIPFDGFEISNVYPNPVSGSNSRFTVEFNIQDQGLTELAIYNEAGVKVQDALSAVLSPGSHSYSLNTGNLASGTYFIRLTHKNTRVRTRLLSLTR
jgi:photosystem II stability/assembly factor-like uncharacterized protein